VDRFSVLAGRAIRSGGRHPFLEQIRRVRRWISHSVRHRQAMQGLRAAGAAVRDQDRALKQANANVRRALDEAEAEGVDTSELSDLLEGEDEERKP
ncbi:MAG TPA: hypothetical protein VHH14_06315, partial [Solirubrobacterales bacterium]|nr:hypothetical protein [Solirubrobacterales bacterium]